MKFISLFCLLFSLSSFAQTNRVGDQILLSGNFSGTPMDIYAEYTYFDGANMAQRQVTRIGGNTVSDETDLIGGEEIITPENAGLVVAMCDSVGGVHEYLNLPVGTTLTCRFNTQSLNRLPSIYSQNLEMMGDTVWVAAFPVLGVAQIQMEGGVLTVQNYHWN